MRAFLRSLLFVAIGPFVGLLAMSTTIGTLTLLTSGSTRDFAFGPVLVSPPILAVTYSIGGVPALLTGIASIFIARRRAGATGWALTALVGAAISLVAALAMFGVPQMSSGIGDVQLIVWITVAGAVAGLVCSALFDGLTAMLGRRRVPA